MEGQGKNGSRVEAGWGNTLGGSDLVFRTLLSGNSGRTRKPSGGQAGTNGICREINFHHGGRAAADNFPGFGDGSLKRNRFP
jgi:hypothetical protein